MIAISCAIVSLVPLNDLSRVPDGLRTSIMSDLEVIVRSGQFLKGPFTNRFEAMLSDRFAGFHATSVANGTDALYLALAALGIDSTSRVATVANAGGYTTGAALRLGASPVYVDVDPSTAQMSASSLAHVLSTSPRVDVVVVTHLYGLVGEVREIATLCLERGIPLIEDCAQSYGAGIDGQPAGTFGDISTFSFYPTKNLGAFGDAGAVLARELSVAQRIRSIAQYGWSERYSVELMNGVNSRMDEMQAAILFHQVSFLDTHNERRRHIVSRYSEALTGDRQMFMAADESFVGHLAVMSSSTRDRDRQLLEASGVGTGIHFPIADFEQIAWRERVGDPALPNTIGVQTRILTLPCFPSMTDAEIAHVVDSLKTLN